jgi:hypothetical protein
MGLARYIENPAAEKPPEADPAWIASDEAKRFMRMSSDGWARAATVRADGARRIYAVDAGPLREVDVWVSRFRGFWQHKLDALATEIARGKRSRRR